MIDAKVLIVILKDDYGISSRGPSYEYNYFYESLKSSCKEVQLFDFGPYLGKTAELQTDLLAAAEAYNPDVIFFTLYEDQFTYETLDKLKSRWVTMNWFCDDQWRFDGFSSRFCKHFTYVTTTDPFALNKYKAVGYDQAFLTQWATKDFLPSLPEKVEYKYDVSFIGGMNPFRLWFISQLQKRGLDVQGFGTGWPNGRVDYAQMNDIFLRSKINLNISNSKNYDLRFVFASLKNFQSYRGAAKNKEQIKGRHFEIGAFGGFQLTNYVEFLENYFSIGKEVAIYNTIDDLTDKIRYYLDHEAERVAIAKAGYERIRRDHTYKQRFVQIFKKILPNSVSA